MDPTASSLDDVETMRRQLMLFAEDLRTISTRERARREEAEAALNETRSAYLTLVRTLAMVADMKDDFTRDHLDRTYQFALSLTARVAPELVNDAGIQYGFLLHDIGKVGVSDQILKKPGPLDDHEWDQMRMHPVIGYQLVKDIKFLGDAVHVVRSHHERWDGRGYPDGIAGEDIYLPARIFLFDNTGASRVLAAVNRLTAITSPMSASRAGMSVADRCLPAVLLVMPLTSVILPADIPRLR